jgi:Flp pilus assembly protein TadG/beta-lactam-binding protein with PASTA domain
MKLPFGLFSRSRDDRTAGQALVEFAIILPVVVLLLVMAVDFGRVYFGWVSLTNAARVGANFAALNGDAWETNDTDVEDEWADLIRANVSGCTLAEPLAAPDFIDMNGDGSDNGSSDHVQVTVHCAFDLITPLASQLFGGGQVAVGAQSTFPVRGEFTGPTGSGGNVPCSGVRVPDLRLKTVAEAETYWTDSGFTGSFTASPTGLPDYIVQSQTLTPAAALNDCVDPSTQVFVSAVAPPPCPSGQAQVPNLTGLTLTDARLAWTAATFTGSFTPASGNNAKVVITQVTNPASVPNGCALQTATVSVTYGDPPPPQCDVPNMVNHSVAEAEDMWADNGFTRNLQVTGSGRGNVLTQDPGFPGRVNCDIRGKVTT